VTTADEGRAQAIAAELDGLNRQRRADQDAILAAADELAAGYADDPVLVLAAPEWSHGVVGIVASKLAEKWHKPTLVAQVLGDHIKGSARSAGGYNMVEALRANAGLLTKFGGHFFAAGYTLPVGQWDVLRQGLNAYYHDSGAADAPVEDRRAPELELADLANVGWPLLEELALLEPHGNGNPRPLVAVSGVAVDSLSKMGKAAQHLRLRLGDARGQQLAAVGFGFCAKHPTLQAGQRLTAIGELHKNEFQGTVSLQLMLAELLYE